MEALRESAERGLRMSVVRWIKAALSTSESEAISTTSMSEEVVRSIVFVSAFAEDLVRAERGLGSAGLGVSAESAVGPGFLLRFRCLRLERGWSGGSEVARWRMESSAELTSSEMKPSSAAGSTGGADSSEGERGRFKLGGLPAGLVGGSSGEGRRGGRGDARRPGGVVRGLWLVRSHAEMWDGQGGGVFGWWWR